MKTGDSLSLAEYHDQLPKFSQRGKYGNKRVTYDGMKFDSKKERDRYQELKLWQKAGLIWSLKTQQKFTFRHKGHALMSYVADFTYLQDGKLVVEDVKGGKGTITRIFAMKKKAMKIWFDIDILLT